MNKSTFARELIVKNKMMRNDYAIGVMFSMSKQLQLYSLLYGYILCFLTLIM